MRLRLVKQGGEQVAGEKGWRLLEQGEMTLGRASTCSWVIADPERRTSSLHCRITRDAQGFALRDESTNGMATWRKRLFIGLAHNAANPALNFNLPEDRTVVMGAHLEL